MPDVRHMDRAPVDDGHVEYLLHGSGDPMLFIHGAGIADAFVAADEPAAFGTSPADSLPAPRLRTEYSCRRTA